MRIQEDDNYKLVYTLYTHPFLGTLIEPNIVLLLNNGSFSLTHQTIHSQNADVFNKVLDDLDYEVIKMIDEIRPDHLVKKFSPIKKIKLKEYFQKHFDQKQFQQLIRPFIEKKLLLILEKLDNKLTYMGLDKSPVHRKVIKDNDTATVLFHFRKNENGTRYFPTIKLRDERVIFMQNGSLILTHKPCWLIAENRLFKIDESVDSKKISPFIRKKFVQVQPENEREYFKTFVTKIMEQYSFYAQGLEVRSIKKEAVPVLIFSQQVQGPWGFSMNLKYGEHEFSYHSEQLVSAKYIEENDESYFLRIRRSRKWEDNKRDFLRGLGLSQTPNGNFRLEDDSFSVGMDWLINHKESIEAAGFEVKVNTTKRYSLIQANITTDIEEGNDWFDVRIKVLFGDFEVPFLQLKKLIEKDIREIELPDGTIGILPEEWFVKMQSLMPYNKEIGQMRLAKSHYNLLHGTGIVSTENWLKLVEDIQSDKMYDLPATFKGELRPYQKNGFNWLCKLKENGFGGCLADDMGLGKTVQTLAFLAHCLEQYKATFLPPDEEAMPAKKQLDIFRSTEENNNQRATQLLVVPTSLIYNWMQESKRFFPSLKVMNYSGQNRQSMVDSIDNYDLIVTSYGTLRNDLEVFKSRSFDVIVLDESQAIKNPKSQVSKAVLQLNSATNIVLTGTPIENSVTDLWSQFNFVDRGLLGGFTKFQKQFIKPIEKNKNADQSTKLKTIIAPFVLRRTKDEVAKDLPQKVEQVIYCEMTEEQASLYEEIKSQYRNNILKIVDKEGVGKNKLNILQGLTQLRLLANHPKMVDDEFEGNSGKYIEFEQKLQTVLSEGHRVLVFSQFVKQIELISDQLNALDIPFLRLDGSTSSKKRSQLVDQFQNGDVPVFLISLKAGGTGLNLTAADYVFIFDPWWNPAVEKQAQDRSHRIGQKKTVFSYKFITLNTVEEKIVRLQKRKQKLSDDLINFDQSFLSELDFEDVHQILQ